MPATPDLIWLVAALLVGFVLGLFPAILLVKSRIEAAHQAGRQELSSDLATLEERLANRNAHLQRLELQLRDKHEERDKLIQERTELERQQARLSTELKEETRRSAENLQILNDAKQELQIQFENLANQIFAEKTRTFADQSKANLDTILTPFKEKIVEFEKKITEVYT
ncbi:MAG: DNA recombination protein RmuC, partial [Desulfuromonadales bacterium]|nr:DNA recombination protein RmuC [Desulfuromonadales bacterium]